MKEALLKKEEQEKNVISKEEQQEKGVISEEEQQEDNVVCEEQKGIVKKRIKLIVAYDGTAYHGWQYQGNANTIEGELNRCLSDLLGTPITVIGASRTDTGVHAMGNIAVFDTDSQIPPQKFTFALNQRLPEDIRVQQAQEVEADFHPRKVQCRKTYQYSIYNAPLPLPTQRLYAHFYHQNLDVNKMEEAAQYLIGEHDFTSFCSVNATAKTRIRTIYWIKVRRENEMVRIEVCGGGFLYHMVRIIAGTLIDVGRGKYAPELIKDILEACDRTKAGPTAPPEGLMLMQFEF